MQNISYNNTDDYNSLDVLEDLPHDSSIPNESETKMLNMLFKPVETSRLAVELKNSMLLIILFCMFSIPQLDGLLEQVLPITKNSIYIRVLVKGVFFALLFWIISNYWLSKKVR